MQEETWCKGVGGLRNSTGFFFCFFLEHAEETLLCMRMCCCERREAPNSWSRLRRMCCSCNLVQVIQDRLSDPLWPVLDYLHLVAVTDQQTTKETGTRPCWETNHKTHSYTWALSSSHILRSSATWLDDFLLKTHTLAVLTKQRGFNN